ncbi:MULTISPECIES: hypothetical protein [Actinomadura]|uniref:Uncharacterized protein n=1 Tax=Actinomadura madurae TaxID=1993 RepID=A0A1I4XHN2_9ACTN|nr:hypothetical protein [Actinomadura madurae]SFN25076.1 hypothetical protein SAMN04489713_101872 [Actinomadura madurae]SPT63489.1 Uncharacterised protein [Actinomadura madurae]
MAGNAVSLVRRVHGRTVDGAPRWAVWAAYGASLVVLPSCIWRIALGFGAPIGPLMPSDGDTHGDVPGWVPMWSYTILLSIVSEFLAFLAVGLVSRWGEVFPSWMPLVGGRRVPTTAAVLPAGIGALLLILLTSSRVPGFDTFTAPDGSTVYIEGWRLGLFIVSYGPLLAWGPLLAVATAAFYLRRRRARS